MATTPRSEFVPALNDVLGWETWGDGPLCECNSLCSERLPLEAWRYIVSEAQFVVLPGHETPGSRIVEKDGFNIEEGDG